MGLKGRNNLGQLSIRLPRIILGIGLSLEVSSFRLLHAVLSGFPSKLNYLMGRVIVYTYLVIDQMSGHLR